MNLEALGALLSLPVERLPRFHACFRSVFGD